MISMNPFTIIVGGPRFARRCHITTVVKFLSLATFFLLAALLVLALPAHALNAPTISPSTGTYAAQQSVTMSASSGTIYYTLDGSLPSTSSTPYTSALTITTPTQINAVAYQAGTYSAVTTAWLDVDAGLMPIPTTIGGTTYLQLRLRSTFGLSTTGLGSPFPVTQWADLSGFTNGHAAYVFNGTAGSQPTVASGINASPVVSFNGTSQYLSISPGFDNGFNGANFFIVTKPNGLMANSRILDFGQGSSGNNIIMQIYSSGSYGSYWTYNGTSGSSTTSSPTAMTQGQYQLLEASQSATSPYPGTFYLNGIAGTAANMNVITVNTNRSSSFLGQASSGGNYYSGNIAELLVYPNSITNSQRMNVEAYLLQKYQILSQVPEAPVISVGNGTTVTLLQPTQVVISSQPGTVTYMTTDGTTPSASSPVYSGTPIPISYSQTLKAIAIKNGVSSSVVSATYTLNSNQFPAPSGSDMTAPTINLQLPVQSQ